MKPRGEVAYRGGPARKGNSAASSGITREGTRPALFEQEIAGPSTSEWETIGETVSVGKPVGGVLPVAFWWRHSFYRITEILTRRFYAGRKELTVRTESGVFRLEENNRAWVVAARDLGTARADRDATAGGL
jgi:hypothetical protein